LYHKIRWTGLGTNNGAGTNTYLEGFIRALELGKGGAGALGALSVTLVLSSFSNYLRMNPGPGIEVLGEDQHSILRVDIYQIDKKHIYMLEFTTSVQLHSDHNRWQPHWKDNAIIHFQQGV
jgi:hypothetical protein